MLAFECPSFGLVGPAEPEVAAELVTGSERKHLLEMVGLDTGSKAHGEERQ